MSVNRNIPVVANFSALPAPATSVGEYYWVETAQGTAWLPGSLGGNYYPEGLYYSNGVIWKWMKSPSQATQVEVDAGTNTDKFLTPETYTNSTLIQRDSTPTASSTNLVTSGGVFTGLGTKQPTLVSATNIKTVNGNTLLGSGDLVISGGGGTPAGITGQIQFNNGGAFGADSGLFWNNTNKRLGVITPIPLAKLHVSSDGYGQDIFRVTYAAGGVDIINAKSGGYGTGTLTLAPTDGVVCNATLKMGFNRILSANSSYIELENGGGGNQSMNFKTVTPSSALGFQFLNSSNAQVFQITSVGNVSIGATAPSARLDVRAQGALSTDIALRVRNSADSANIISISGNGQFTLGLGAVTGGLTAVTIGNNASTGTATSIAIGGAGANTGAASDSSMAIGYAASVTGSRGVALGFLTRVTGSAGISLGERSSVTATSGIAIGAASSVSAAYSLMIGFGLANAIPNSNAFNNGGINGYSFFNDSNSNYVINSSVIPVNNISYLNTTKNVLYLGTGIKPASTIKNGVQIYTNYRTITQASSTAGATASGTANLKVLTFSAGADMSALTVGTRLIITNSVAEQTHANIVSVVGLVVTIDTALVNTNTLTLNANATAVGNTTVVIVSDFHQETRNDNGDIIKLYQETTAIGAATLVSNLGTPLTDTDTFDGYTLKQIVKALRNQGLLT